MNWAIKRIKDIKSSKANAFADGPFGSNLKTEHFVENGDVLVIDSGYITSGNFAIHREFKTISFEHFLTVKRSECKDGDLIIAKIGANFGMSAILPKLDKPSLVSGNTLKLTINDRLYFNKFIHYQFLNKKTLGEIDVLVKGSAQPALSMGLLNDIEFILPNNLQEQQAIANYLDAKTQAIDKKISLLEQKIETYKQLKRTLINQTITKGLDKNVPLKNSGISWIGQIPQHWEVKRFKDVLYLFTGNSISDKNGFDYIENSIPYVSTKDIDFNTNEINYENGMYIPKSDKVFKRAKKGTCLICIEGANAGKKYGILNQEVAFVNKLAALKFKANRNFDKYLYHYIQSIAFSGEFFPLINGLIGGVSVNKLKEFNIILPPISEQEEIAKYLDHKTATIDAIVSNIGKQIETLKQLRKTLINDVVTGKIKVIE
ncbi:restriction endonuclease subunit S [Empedobacter sp. UBA5637]|uniref:restriction endonuclease subunit S n=1 Tax=Empedobacter sp. UBA5637 TaxID=1946442 RepID=UPI0025C09FF7|nr:restriction endonuclease subunit S [Empedobacter sp. UBA5637]